MRTAYIATGAANMYCGSCMKDNTTAAAMRALGHDVVLIPTYTPIRLDEEDVSQDRVFVGGIEAFLLQRFPNGSRLGRVIPRLFRSQFLLRLLKNIDIGAATDPMRNADLTLSMLRGEAGNQASLIHEMADWLADDLKPDVVHITNTLVIGFARAIKQRLDVPIICGLHGEDIFLEGLPPSHQQEALAIIRDRSADIDRFVAVSDYYADTFGRWLGLDPAKIDVVKLGIALDDYVAMTATGSPSLATNGAGPTIGYFARIDPAKGLHLLAEAFVHLCQSGEFPDVRLRVGGYLSRGYASYLNQVRRILKKGKVEDRVEILGTLERDEKLAFFRSIDLLSVPTVYRDPKGIFVLEAMASGVPVVQPRHGAFPEIVEATGGGLLHEPANAADLADKLAQVLRDDDLRRQLGEQGQTAVFNHFNAERMARETIAIYQSLV